VSYTKREFVYAAFAEIGYASYAFDLDSNDIEAAMRRMDSMLAGWNALGIRIGYPLPANPTDSDLDELTTVPDSANESIITNLAIRIAPGLGKTVSQDTKITARAAYSTLLARSAMPSEIQLGSLPSGAGNKSFDSPFLAEPESPLTVGNDSELTFE